MNTKTAAERFASVWYQRTGMCCDEATLAAMLAYELHDIFQAGVVHERNRIKRKIEKELGVQ